MSDRIFAFCNMCDPTGEEKGFRRERMATERFELNGVFNKRLKKPDFDLCERHLVQVFGADAVSKRPIHKKSGLKAVAARKIPASMKKDKGVKAPAKPTSTKPKNWWTPDGPCENCGAGPWKMAGHKGRHMWSQHNGKKEKVKKVA